MAIRQGAGMGFGCVFGVLFGILALAGATIGGCMLLVGGCTVAVNEAQKQAQESQRKAGATGGASSSTSTSGGGAASESTASGPARPTDLAVSSAEALLAHYQANEVAGDQDFKGKLFAVQGRVETVGKDLLDTPYVALRGGPSTLFSVQCMFSKADEGKLAGIKPGDWVTIAGTGRGKLGNVVVGDCWIYGTGAPATAAEKAAAAKQAERKAAAEKRRAGLEDRRKAAEAKRVMRTWTSGQFTIEAKFLSVTAGQVKLEKADGSTIDVPLERLSDADREWIRTGPQKAQDGAASE